MMKIIQHNKWFTIALLLLSTSMANASISLGFGTPVQTGDSIDVDVLISGLGVDVAPSLSTYDLDILFDSSHLAFSTASFGDAVLGNQLDLFDFDANASETTVETDRVNIYEVSFDDAEDLNNLQADSFSLATLTFSALKADSTQLSFIVNDLGDAGANLLSTSLTTATVTTVPVPAAFWLMLTGLSICLRNAHAP